MKIAFLLEKGVFNEFCAAFFNEFFCVMHLLIGWLSEWMSVFFVPRCMG
jgi:hypothetical protein